MKKRAIKFKDESIRQALKKVDNPWDMVAFLFVYRSKEFMFIIIIVLIGVMAYPEILEFLKRLI